MDPKPQEPRNDGSDNSTRSSVRSTPDVGPPQRLTRLEKRSSAEDRVLHDIEREDNANVLRTNDDFEEPYDPPKKKHKFLRKIAAFIGWILLVVALTGAGGGAAWYFWLKDEPKQASEQQETPPAATPPTIVEAETEEYTSSAFQMQFDYPKDWKVTEGTDNKIIGISPVTSIKTASGGKQTGQIVFTVQHKQTSLPDFSTGSALAIRESEKIDYKKPSTVQRGSTYISFLSYAASANSGLDGVYVTGDNGYIKDQYVPMADIAKSDPLITFTFRSCKDDKCATPDKAMTIADSNWSTDGFVKPLRAMLQSIVVQ